MVRKIVVAVAGFDVPELDGRRIHAVEEERHGAGGVCLEGEPRHVVHQLDLVHVSLRTGRVERHRRRHLRFRLAFPLARHLQALLQVADAGEVLIEPITVARSHRALEFLRLAGDRVEDALARLELAHLRLGLSLRSLKKHPGENVRCLFLARNQDTGSRPRQTADALLHVDAKRE